MADALDARALFGARGTGCAVLALIVAFVVFWTVFATLSRYNLDIHGDMVENFAWGIGWQLGYYKHPPLFAWISAGWLSVFPRTNLFYHLLSMSSVAVAALAMWRISTRFFTADQQVLLVAMVFFLPPLTFLSINYNATSAMAPFWALALLFYIRTLEARRALDAFLVGLIVGLAMLAKYQSVVLLLTIFGHAVMDREARPLFRTRLPLVAALGGLLPIAPHIFWLVSNDFVTVRYAAEQGDGAASTVWWSALQFLPAILLYALPGFLLLLAHRYPRDGWPLIAHDQVLAFQHSVAGRALLAAIVLPPVLTIALGLALDAQLSSLWSIPFFVFIPFLMVAIMPRVFAARRTFVVPLMIALFVSVALLLAPFIERYTLSIARSNSAIPIKDIAVAVQGVWREQAGQPLAIVFGDTAFLANGVSFYARDRPFAVQAGSLALTPWVTAADLERQGALFICQGPNRDPRCRGAADHALGKIDRVEPLVVASPAGSGLPPRLRYQLYLRLPAVQTATP